MELITDNFFEWVVVALAILNFIVTLKSKEKITLAISPPARGSKPET